MPTDAINLLKRLNPPIRPGGASGDHLVPMKAPFEAQGFENLLTLAAQREIASDRPIDPPALTTGGPLGEPQLARLAQAADAAEAAGFSRALLLLEGRAFVLDVAARRIEQELQAESDPQTCIVDGAVRADIQESGAALALPRGPAQGLMPARIHEQIERSRQADPSGGQRVKSSHSNTVKSRRGSHRAG